MSFKFENISLLLVEDTAPMRQLLVAVLNNLGVQNIDVAENGRQAIEIFKQKNHDLILTDWSMEPMNGLELTKEVRQSDSSPNPMVSIIMITGYSAWSRVEQARDIGVTEFLVKPFSANDVAKRIAHAINHPRDFIETDHFFGPDRRRRNNAAYQGPFRRISDQKQGKADE